MRSIIGCADYVEGKREMIASCDVDGCYDRWLCLAASRQGRRNGRICKNLFVAEMSCDAGTACCDQEAQMLMGVCFLCQRTGAACCDREARRLLVLEFLFLRIRNACHDFGSGTQKMTIVEAEVHAGRLQGLCVMKFVPCGNKGQGSRNM